MRDSHSGFRLLGTFFPLSAFGEQSKVPTVDRVVIIGSSRSGSLLYRSGEDLKPGDEGKMWEMWENLEMEDSSSSRSSRLSKVSNELYFFTQSLHTWSVYLHTNHVFLHFSKLEIGN